MSAEFPPQNEMTKEEAITLKYQYEEILGGLENDERSGMEKLTQLRFLKSEIDRVRDTNPEALESYTQQMAQAKEMDYSETEINLLIEMANRTPDVQDKEFLKSLALANSQNNERSELLEEQYASKFPKIMTRLHEMFPELSQTLAKPFGHRDAIERAQVAVATTCAALDYFREKYINVCKLADAE